MLYRKAVLCSILALTLACAAAFFTGLVDKNSLTMAGRADGDLLKHHAALVSAFFVAASVVSANAVFCAVKLSMTVSTF